MLLRSKSAKSDDVVGSSSPFAKRQKVSIEDILRHYDIAKSISHALRPLNHIDALDDLSCTSKATKALHAALAPFLFRSINVERFQRAQWTSYSIKRAFLNNRLAWRKGVYAWVHELYLPERASPPILASYLDFAKCLPNLRALFLPVDGYTFDVDFNSWPKLETLGCNLGPLPSTLLSSRPPIKSLHLHTAITFPGYIPADYSTDAICLYISGSMVDFFRLRESGREWKELAPRLTKLAVQDDSAPERSYFTPPGPIPLSEMAALSTVQDFSLFVVGMIPNNEGMLYTPFGLTKSLPELSGRILRDLKKEGHCPELQSFRIAVEVCDVHLCFGFHVPKEALKEENYVGAAVILAKEYEHSRNWREKNLAYWRICTGIIDGEKWTFSEVEKVIWQKEKDYPFVLEDFI